MHLGHTIDQRQAQPGALILPRQPAIELDEGLNIISNFDLNDPRDERQKLARRLLTLQMLDSVLRRGQTLEAASSGAVRLSAQDKALSIAIAGEALRRLPDLDDLIDSATRQRLPDDSKARMVLRLALAQKIGLGTPDHALVATALPLVDGGPRRLVHGVLGTLLRRGQFSDAPPHLPADVEDRWSRAWGNSVVEAARRQIASRPALDLSFADESEAGFIGLVACIRSADSALRYSGWLALYELLPRSHREVLPALAPQVAADLRAIDARLRRRYQPALAQAQERMYDRFLKANRVEEGIASYGLAVRLVLGSRMIG